MIVEELIKNYPVLYHMAENGSWDGIKKHGLLSTSALLNLYDYQGLEREKIESFHRPESVKINSEGMPDAVIRDQKPMYDSGLERCLQDNLKPKDWYEILNSKIFFWTSEERLHRLLTAGAYVNDEHDVLTIDTALLVEEHQKEILLSSMNSGCTKPFPHPRGLDTFQTIEDYPYSLWLKKRRVWDAVVEVCVEGGVINIEKMVRQVRRMRGKEVLGIIY